MGGRGHFPEVPQGRSGVEGARSITFLDAGCRPPWGRQGLKENLLTSSASRPMIRASRKSRMNLRHAVSIALVGGYALLAGCFTPTALKAVMACQNSGGDRSACENASHAYRESSQHCADGDAAACRDYVAARLQMDYVLCQGGNQQGCDDHDKTEAAIHNAAELSALQQPSSSPPTQMIRQPTFTNCFRTGNGFNCSTY